MEEIHAVTSEVPEQCNNFTETSREPNLATSSIIPSCNSSAKTDPIIVVDQIEVSDSDSDSESDNNVEEEEIVIDKQNTKCGNEDQFIASTNSSFSDSSSIISSVEPNGSNNLEKTNNISTAEETIRNLIPADSSLCNLLVYGNSTDEEGDVDSDNDQSSDSYSCDSDNGENDEVEIVQNSASQMPKPIQQRKMKSVVDSSIKSMGELSLNDLPPVPDVSTMQIDDVSTEECDEMGMIASVVDTLVMVESIPDKPAYDVDTLLFLDGGRQPLGYIFDVIGPVAAPMYAVRFNSAAEIQLLNIRRGVKVFCAPKSAKHTQYVFVQQLLAAKGTDASWKDDIELPGGATAACGPDVNDGGLPSDFEPDYSDDEQEVQAARQRRFLQQRGGTREAAALMAGSRRLKHKRNSLERHRSFEKDMNVRNLMDTNIHRLRETYFEAPPLQKRHAPNGHHFHPHMHQPPSAPPPPPPRHGFPPPLPPPGTVAAAAALAAAAAFGPMPFGPCAFHHHMGPPVGPPPPPPFAVNPFLGMPPPPPHHHQHHQFVPPPNAATAAFLSRLGPPPSPNAGPPPNHPFVTVGPPPPSAGGRFGGGGGGHLPTAQWKPCDGGLFHSLVDLKTRPPPPPPLSTAGGPPRFLFMANQQQQQQQQQPPLPPPPLAATGFLFYDPRAICATGPQQPPPPPPMRPWHPMQPQQMHQQHHQQQQHQRPPQCYQKGVGPRNGAANAGTSQFYHSKRS